ncbi:MFS transporter [Rhodococcus sp. BP-316]|uniref:MFS transporter n=1 Tax=Rhodococcus sp. BP-316 TaxID=2739445 RepID=UPI001C9B5B08|nr:MFS transporter [Rhodococcus sp. BP-316]MBY6681794.1 MFS transporter [Rhodococcus sp. BP-316]
MSAHHVSGAAPAATRLNAENAYTPRERKTVLTFAIVGALIESMELNLLSYPLRDLSDSFDVSTQAVVTVITLQSIASIAGGFIFGWTADKWGRRPTYVAFTTIYGTLAILGAFLTNFELFTITRVVAGIAMGGAFGVIFAMFTETWKTKNRGLMGSVLQGMFICGTLITQAILFATITSFGSNTGWRTGFVVIGAMSVGIGVVAFRSLPESKLWRAARDADTATSRQGLGEDGSDERPSAPAPPPTEHRTRVVLGGLFLTLATTGIFAASYCYITFGPTYLREYAGLSLGWSTIVLSIGTLLGIASYIIFGALSDRIGRRGSTFWSCAVGVLGFGLFLTIGSDTETVQGTGDTWSVATAALAGAAIGYAGFGVIGTWISEFYPTRYRALGSGATYYVARGVGSGLFPLFALMAADGNVHRAMGFGVIGAIVGMIGCLFVPDTRDKVITTGS